MTAIAAPGAQLETEARARALRPVLLLVSIGVLAIVCLASLAIGSKPLPLDVVLAGLFHPDGSPDSLIITELRIPRTVLGVLVGAALGVAGALIQAFTRNPLADPGILGVNAGANLAVVLGVAVFGVTSVTQYLPFAFIGAIGATVVVYGIARRGGGGATPLRLTLVGLALSAVLGGMASTLALINPTAFNHLRFWAAGDLADREPEVIPVVAGFIVGGLVIALLLARSLNAFALGDDLARTLGARIGITRMATVVAVTLLCGAATAAVGPIAFVGLMVPHAVRWLTGPDQRWILPFSLVLAPVLLLVSDIIGRLIVWPAELQVGIVSAFLGAPVLIYLVRRTKAAAL
ncbi:iron chelate uptake ABC transporter family permease subunit [Microbacterium invictum]|uniref:Iron complex transport system permease protein n=1 Tax=Microbacterium invictum TaxID=515415 RepID=A0AA40SNJ4_9MICO|nr:MULTISPECIES: iron chelate uptake ABC transporter family permease subunit [Microbacterium]MBB4139434.1 iron complex transport system permease protein [Microbacterium invictum]